MKFREKLQAIRNERNLSQEKVAEKLNISRQAVAKWETGQAFPDIDNLIQLSDLFKVTIDCLVKDSSECSKSFTAYAEPNYKVITSFLCEAKKNTYAGKGKEENSPSRLKSHDLVFKKGRYDYLDTYLGGEKFVGEEAIWMDENPIWAMNYLGKVLAEQFSGDFLKEALLLVPEDYPFRGPSIHKNGDYTYYCSIVGDFSWFHGKEEIFYSNRKVYDCLFHGGTVK